MLKVAYIFGSCRPDLKTGGGEGRPSERRKALLYAMMA
jgi:hypothetical protein